jgi:molybdopterin molybdotransferase
LTSSNDALKIVLNSIQALEPENKATFNCVGQVLAEDIYSDLDKNTLLMPRGTVIGPNHIFVMMSVGRKRIKVVRRPLLAILSTGSELTSPDSSSHFGEENDCNNAVISSMINHCGGISRVLGIAHDHEISIITKIRKGLRKGLRYDALITTGGVSQGESDLMRNVIEKYGEVKFSRKDMGPEASFTFGMITGTTVSSQNEAFPVFALSGAFSNCIINFETIVRPAILKMMGVSILGHASIMASSDNSIPEKKPIASAIWTYLYWEKGEYRVRINGYDKKEIYDVMARTNSLTIIPEHTAVRKGDKVQVWILDWSKEFLPLLVNHLE